MASRNFSLVCKEFVLSLLVFGSVFCYADTGLDLLDELDRLAGIRIGEDSPTEGTAKHVCEYREPYIRSVYRINSKNGPRNERRLRFRFVKRCCPGWNGKDCNHRIEQDVANFRRQLSKAGKPGYCPLNQVPMKINRTLTTSCASNCQQDDDCATNLKCCRNHCGGFSCTPPLSTQAASPGACPIGQVSVIRRDPSCPQRACASDSSCSNGYKCCRPHQNTCGRCVPKRCSPSCQNGGSCSNGVCRCPVGYSGNGCEQALNSSPCLKTKVTIGFNTVPTNAKRSMNHSQAVSIMAGVLQIVRKRLKLCPNITAKLGKITFHVRSGNASIQGLFEFHPSHFTSSLQQRNARDCLNNASMFEDIWKKLNRTILKMNGILLTTSSKFSSFHNGTCCDHGFILLNTQCVKCPAGTYHDVYKSRCVGCHGNTYQPNEASRLCLPCPKGQISDGQNATSCKAGCWPPCQNNGFCRKSSCYCSLGYTGTHCQEAVCVPSCLNGGVCSSPNNCTCSEGWSGVNCNKAICSNGCLNGGTCIAPNHCQCAVGFTGRFCETAHCDGGCNLGRCVAHNTCVCPPSHTGSNCETAIITTAGPLMSTAWPVKRNEPDVCFTWGGAHYKTFDGRYFYFAGRCTYKLVHDCQDQMFSVHVVNDLKCQNQTSCSVGVNLYLGGVDIKIHLGQSGRVSVDGRYVILPTVVKNIVIEKVGKYVRVYGYSGMLVTWDGRDSVYVHMPRNHRNKTCGLCGNYNHIPDDDFVTLLGQRVTSVARFANSWKMPAVQGDTCENVPDNKSPCLKLTAKELQQIRQSCRVLLNPLFSNCHSVLDPSDFIQACQEHLCTCKSNTSNCLCAPLTQYSRACARNRAPVTWRRKDLCPESCPSKMEFTECGSACPRTCSTRYKSYICHAQCLDGCQCTGDTLFDGQRCVQQAQCHCEHNKKKYVSGSVIRRDCNNCTCLSGRWRCSNNKCPATCSATGDAHYVTFDGLRYSYAGNCRYILVKDCVNDTFAVVVSNTGCGSDSRRACKRKVHIHLNSTVIVLKRGGDTILDGSRITVYPHVTQDFIIRQLSSTMTSVDSPLGISVRWNGHTRVYVTLQPHFQDRTCGLCGTFNNNQNDDLTTTERVVETSIRSFGESWKTNPMCNETRPSKHPCEMQVQRKAYAEKMCNKLLQAPFDLCHNTLDPRNGYVSSCTYDVCGCRDGALCLCSAIASYVHDCAQKGVVIHWRNAKVLSDCIVTCSKQSQVHQECSTSCHHTCRDASMNVECGTNECVEGCNCPNGTALNYNGDCVPYSQCSCYDQGKRYDSGAVIKPDNCTECTCEDGRFLCKNKTCKACPVGQQWVRCGAQCAKTCDNFHLPCLEPACRSGCVCPGDIVWNGQRCVPTSQCVCHYGGRAYRPGEKITKNCNMCTCRGTEWSCTSNDCPGTCTVYGDPNYITFDKKRYRFHGACEYVLATDHCDDGRNGTFRIHTENVPCGTTGVTCTKRITVTLNDTEIRFVKGMKATVSPLAGASNSSITAWYRIRDIHFFTILETNIGLTMMWDRGTRLYVTLDPKFKGKTCGLCGNFNDNQNDDFLTPEMVTEAQANLFADSWKADQSCPDAVVPKLSACDTNQHRAPWAHKMCNIMRRELFKPCHKLVDPSPWYDACYYDTCACDSGGDCECLCTAIAAYAQECSKHGVAVRWRSQQLCPIQCPKQDNTCSEYKQCGTACPKTCRNLCDVTPTTCPVSCVEGCFCPNGTVMHDGKCMDQAKCPCYVNGREHASGSLVIKNCQTCKCDAGCLVCSGPTCLPSGTPQAPVTTTTPITSGKGQTQLLTTSKTLTTSTTGSFPAISSSKPPVTSLPTLKTQLPGTSESRLSSAFPGSSRPSTSTKQAVITPQLEVNTISSGSFQPQATQLPVTTKYSVTSQRPVSTTLPGTSQPPSTTRISGTSKPTVTAIPTNSSQGVTSGSSRKTQTPAATKFPSTSQPQSTTKQSVTARPTVIATSQGSSKPHVTSGSAGISEQPGTSQPSGTTGHSGASRPTVTTTSKSSSQSHVTSGLPTISQQPVTTKLFGSSQKPSTTRLSGVSRPTVTNISPGTSQTRATSVLPGKSQSPVTKNLSRTFPPSVTTQPSGTSQPEVTIASKSSSQPQVTSGSPGKSQPVVTTKLSSSSRPTATTMSPDSSQSQVTVGSPGISQPSITTETTSTSSKISITSTSFTRPRLTSGSPGTHETTVTTKLPGTSPTPSASRLPKLKSTSQSPKTTQSGTVDTASPSDVSSQYKTTKVPTTSQFPGISVKTGSKATSGSTEQIGTRQPTFVGQNQSTTESPSGTAFLPCVDPLGMKSKKIPDSSITASSILSWYYSASKGRLDNQHIQGSGGSWCPNQQSDDNPYLQVDLGSLTQVTKISTQGSPALREYTQYYMLFFSDNGTSWTAYKQGGKTKIFKGNTDNTGTVSHILMPSIVSRYVRVKPYRWRIRPCMRIELYGCKYYPTISPGSPLPTSPTLSTTVSATAGSTRMHSTNFGSSSQRSTFSTSQGTTVQRSSVKSGSPSTAVNVVQTTENTEDFTTKISVIGPVTGSQGTPGSHVKQTETTVKPNTKQSATSLPRTTLKSKSSSQPLITNPNGTTTSPHKSTTVGVTVSGSNPVVPTTNQIVCGTCSPNDFTCSSGCECFPQAWVCDGNSDCSDSSDEFNCTNTPPPSTTPFLVPTTPVCEGDKIYTSCKPSCEQRCQWMNNQPCNNSVPAFCTPGCTCERGTVLNGTHCVNPVDCHCKYGRIFYKAGSSWTDGCNVCSCWNNDIICSSKPCPTIAGCSSDQFMIVTLPGECCEKCVLRNYTIPTPSPICVHPLVPCGGGQCVSQQWMCDGEKDCDGGEDENNCTTKIICNEPLGVENRNIPESAMFASSELSARNSASEGRLNNVRPLGSWCANHKVDRRPFLQIDLGSTTRVRKIATQGSRVFGYVKSYKLQYSTNQVNWVQYEEDNGTAKNFTGNTDNTGIVIHKLTRAINTRYIRVIPVQWNAGICLRIELYGCRLQSPTTPPVASNFTRFACPEFACRNGKCIPYRWACDKENDCGDWSDERCNGSCTHAQYRCSNGKCIDKRFVCDGDDDCNDRSDELNCANITCPEFRCNDGKCIPYKFICDGETDCYGGEDERQSCPTRAPSISTAVPCLGFTCKDGTCLPGNRRCDHYIDCPWGEDEENCGCKNSTEWKCPGSDKCISLAHRCDKIVDCPLGEDEMQCLITKVPGNLETTVSPIAGKTSTSTTSSGSVWCPRECSCSVDCNAKIICWSSKTCPMSCECEPGYIRSGGRCVVPMPIPCLPPCIYKGSKYGHGHTTIQGECRECSCIHKPNTLSDSTWSCYKKCQIKRCPVDKVLYEPPDECCRCIPSNTTSTTATLTTRTTATTPFGPSCPGPNCTCAQTCDEFVDSVAAKCTPEKCPGCKVCPLGHVVNHGRCVLPQDPVSGCRCILNNTFYKAGQIVNNGTCSRCLCINDSWSCVRSCNIISCPSGQELANTAGKCCFCREKPICRPDMVYSACACNLTCTAGPRNSCIALNCIPGCQCPPGFYDNGTNCVTRDDCFCSYNGTVRKANERWFEGECSMCKCTAGNIKCNSMCTISQCPIGEVLETPLNSCCRCVPKVTTPLVQSTPAGGSCRYNGSVYQAGTSWKPSKCKDCRCEADGNVNCLLTQCSLQTCPVGTKNVQGPTSCCPVCHPLATVGPPETTVFPNSTNGITQASTKVSPTTTITTTTKNGTTPYATAVNTKTTNYNQTTSMSVETPTESFNVSTATKQYATSVNGSSTKTKPVTGRTSTYPITASSTENIRGTLNTTASNATGLSTATVPSTMNATGSTSTRTGFTGYHRATTSATRLSTRTTEPKGVTSAPFPTTTVATVNVTSLQTTTSPSTANASGSSTTAVNSTRNSIPFTLTAPSTQNVSVASMSTEQQRTTEKSVTTATNPSTSTGLLTASTTSSSANFSSSTTQNPANVSTFKTSKPSTKKFTQSSSNLSSGSTTVPSEIPSTSTGTESSVINGTTTSVRASTKPNIITTIGIHTTSSTSTAKGSSHASSMRPFTASPSESANIPVCDVKSVNTWLTDNTGCRSIEPVYQTSCQGVCESKTVINDTEPFLEISCHCCKPLDIGVKTSNMRCNDGSKKRYSYLVIKTCSCIQCESNVYKAKLDKLMLQIKTNNRKQGFQGQFKRYS